MARWSRFEPAADRRLVKGLTAGDEESLAKLYDIYAERLYDYCGSCVSDARSAGNVVHDTLIDAYRRVGRLRDRDRLRAWLYAAARRRCIQQGRNGTMSWDCTGAAAPGADEVENGALAGDLCQRVQKAFKKLSLADQEALFLALRHDLDAADLGVILGESQRRTQSRLDRGRVWLTHAAPVSSVSIALDPHQAPKLPANLRHRVLHSASDPELAGYRADIVARAGGLGPDGFPRQPGSRTPLRRRWLFAGSGLSAAVTGVAAVLLLVSSSTSGAGTWPFDPAPQPQPSKSLPSTGAPPKTTPPGQGPGHGDRPAPRPITGGDGAANPSPQPQHPPPTLPGRLTVRPDRIDLSGKDEARIFLRAENDAVTWTAAELSPAISLSRVRGTVPAGGEMTVRVVLNRGLVQLPGTTPITILESTGTQSTEIGPLGIIGTGDAYGSRKHTVLVSWPLSLL